MSSILYRIVRIHNVLGLCFKSKKQRMNIIKKSDTIPYWLVNSEPSTEVRIWASFCHAHKVNYVKMLHLLRQSLTDSFQRKIWS